MPHYVYLYRDEKKRPRYVGYGKRVTRANAHRTKSHNPKLADFVRKKNNHTIEVAGPFKTKEVGLLVETAVMSALDPDFNVAKGQSHARFRPLGVPDDYSERLSLTVLQRDDFISVQKNPPMPVLFVKINDRNFDDGRIGYDLANPPTDDQIHKRVEESWQLARFIPRWVKKRNESPGLLIGIAGSPGSQIVIASLKINQNAWANAERHSRGKIRIPLLQTPNLDAFKLRGRQISREAKLAFNSFTAGQYIVLNLDGTLIGGRRSRKR